ncbi:DUF4097 family beta strand repeat-containing protein [Listeria ilorinensis]|uniref:DUF4097 family beta strand repeat-containing protein n=1 Tax=Listeria ilorinensis TaxID=2867439 RepID=UPI001EF56D32|nr:DUF4097 family beta strand repeat-containing protein [Listeria ilorinensis]
MDKKLKRSRIDRKIGGVFGGVSEYTGIDATLLRLIFVVVAVITMKTGIAVIAYIIALFVIPSDDTSTEEVIEHHRRRVEEKRHNANERRREHYERAQQHRREHMDKVQRHNKEHYDRHKERIDSSRERANRAPGTASARKNGTSRTWPVREFDFEATTFQNLTLRIATGDVTLRSWDKEDVKMRVVLAVHEKARSIRQLNEEQLWDYFFAQTMLDISTDRFVFESKKDILKTDIVLTLPKRLFEQVKIQLLNGNLKYDDIAVEDAIIKLRHGDVRSKGASGKFLSTEVADGEIYFQKSSVENVDMTTAKGDVVLEGNYLTAAAKSQNGDVEFLLQNDSATSVDLAAPHGDIKMALPASWNVDGTLHTKREKIMFDLKNAKIWDDSDRTLVFTQNAEEISTGTLQAKVENGIIKVVEVESEKR